LKLKTSSASFPFSFLPSDVDWNGGILSNDRSRRIS
jgi:hypothetical protein